MPRIFVYDGREHPDPDPGRTVDEVRQELAAFYPELGTAVTKGPTQRGANEVYEFEKRVGTKGAGADAPVLTHATVLGWLEEENGRCLDDEDDRKAVATFLMQQLTPHLVPNNGMVDALKIVQRHTRSPYVKATIATALERAIPVPHASA